MNAAELIELLKVLPPDTIVKCEKWEDLRSYDPNDTDLSCYVDADISRIEVNDNWVEWPKNDPRRTDKRRTQFCDKFGKVAVIKMKGR
jgi:hypothetical protein